MTAPSGIRASVGFRHAQILAIDSSGSGYPAASVITNGSAAYDGVNVLGAKLLTLNDPEPREAIHIGDDSIVALDVLPSLTPLNGELNIAVTDDTISAVIGGGTKQFSLGNAGAYATGVTDKKGSEGQVIILAYRESLNEDATDATQGSRFWDWRIFPKAWLIERDTGMDINATNETRIYTMRPNIVTKLPWGTVLTSGSHGVIKTQGIRGMSNARPHLAAWIGNGSATNMVLPTNYPLSAVADIYALFVGGSASAVTNSASSLSTIAFSSAPTDQKYIVMLYGTSGTA